MKSWKTKSGYEIKRLIYGRSNVFLLTSDNKRILVDTSPGVYWKKLEKKIEKYSNGRIDILILTHAHFDHAYNTIRIKEKYKSSVYIHCNEADKLLNGENPETNGSNIMTKIITSLFGKTFMRMKNYHGCSADVMVYDRYDFEVEGLHAYLIHTPGHSAGSMSLIIDNEIAIVGDCLFGVFKTSVFPPFVTSPQDLTASWCRLIETGCSIFLPSHGNEKTRNQLIKDYIRHK